MYPTARHSFDTADLVRPVVGWLARRLERARAWGSETYRRLPVLDVVIAAWLLLAATAMSYADELMQDWIPEVLQIPEDAEVVTDRAIGSTVRLFAISTASDVDTLLTDWEQTLGDNGFIVQQGAEDLLDRSIEFSGPGIRNAKIIVAPTADDARKVVEFDATLE